MTERVVAGMVDELREAGHLTTKVGSQPICVLWNDGRRPKPH
jgi:hypothetical protein